MPPPQEPRKSGENAQKCFDLAQKIKTFSEEEAQPPPQTLPLMGRETPHQTPLLPIDPDPGYTSDSQPQNYIHHECIMMNITQM